MSEALLVVRGLRVNYWLPPNRPWRRALSIRAVDDVDFDLKPGETLGIAGESGCGKSTLARALTGLQPITAGSARLAGQELKDLDRAGWRTLRREVQMVFQDTIASLDPRMTVSQIIAEPLTNLYPQMASAEQRDRVLEIAEQVGLPGRDLHRYPHEFSGGQCQRIGIARALVARPSVLICDEPASALDVSIRAQIINLLKGLQNKHNLAMIFISHDLAVLKSISHCVLIMYLGKVMEQARCEKLFADPAHPYTRALLSAAPLADPLQERARRRIALRGEPSSPTTPPAGCVFHARCPWVAERCKREIPVARQFAPHRVVACHFAGRLGDVPAQCSGAGQ
ncbi:MAG: ATP-binding cassette domain-containing protein [Gammaproteobacteria bacterium]|nr:ATP-binding cassette domain-containing protein [Gammaproteobacteria bacterium]